MQASARYVPKMCCRDSWGCNRWVASPSWRNSSVQFRTESIDWSCRRTFCGKCQRATYGGAQHHHLDSSPTASLSTVPPVLLLPTIFAAYFGRARSRERENRRSVRSPMPVADMGHIFRINTRGCMPQHTPNPILFVMLLCWLMFCSLYVAFQL